MAHDALELITAITKAGFRYDNPTNFCEHLASLATSGKGFREPDASPAFHFQIADKDLLPNDKKHLPNFCNIHLDAYGFVSTAPDGTKYYNPDLFQHIIGDLAWPIVQQKLFTKLPFNGLTHHITDRLYPIILPTSKTQYHWQASGLFHLIQRPSFGASLNWNYINSANFDKRHLYTSTRTWVRGIGASDPSINMHYDRGNYTVSADLDLGSSFTRPVNKIMINLSITNWGSR